MFTFKQDKNSCVQTFLCYQKNQKENKNQIFFFFFHKNPPALIETFKYQELVVTLTDARWAAAARNFNPEKSKAVQNDPDAH